MNELFVSVDIEATGPIPGPYSMLSLGALAFSINNRHELEEVGRFYTNIEELPGATWEPSTKSWWETQEEALKQATLDPIDPKTAMDSFSTWIDLKSKYQAKLPVFVAYPAGFDFTFVYWYLIHFTGKSPFSFSALDIKSYAMAFLGTEYRKTTKKNMPRHWFDSSKKHTHNALEDAIEQAHLFAKIYKDVKTNNL